jgi:hypothetical protein
LFEVLSQRRYDSVSRDRVRTLPFSWLLQRCLEEHPEDRCDLNEALAIFARGSKATPPPPPRPVVPERVPERVPEPRAPEPPAPEPVVFAPVMPPPMPEVVAEAPAAAAAVELPVEPVAQHAQQAEVEAEVETLVQASILEMPAAKIVEPDKPAEPAVEEPKPESSYTPTGAAARVAAAEEARKAAAAGEAFRKASSAASGTSSILSAPLPAESRHKPAEMKRKPVAAKIRHVGSGLGLSDDAYEADALADRAVARLSTDPMPWTTKSKPRTWQLAVAGTSIVIMLLAVIFLVVVPRLQSPIEPAGPVQGPSAAATAKDNAWQTKTLAPPPVDANAARTRPPASQAAQANRTPAEIAGAPTDNGVGNWRLVLYSYKYKQDAERRILLLKRSHPALDARLFIPVKKWPFMVVLGGPMSKSAADDLKQQAVAQGLPRAIYVQRF